MPTDFIDKLTFLSHPSGRAEGKHHIVIVGAGIIGVCTAYYLTRHPDFDASTHHITVLESKRVAGGASGKAGGLLASWAFPQQIVPLSFQLHQELSDEYDGDEKWDYRRLTTVSLEADVRSVGKKNKGAAQALKRRKRKVREDFHCSNVAEDAVAATRTRSKTKSFGSEDDENGKGENGGNDEEHDYEDDDGEGELEMDEEDFFTPGEEEPEGGDPSVALPADLNWIKKSLVKDWSSLGGTDSTAQVHPYKFTHFLLSKAMESGAVDLVLGKVSRLHCTDSGVCTGVSYKPMTDDDSSSSAEVNIEDAQQVVLTMGPWTSKILPDCPISGLRAHSITIKPSTGTVSPYAIFTELKIGKNQYFSPEMYARKDEVYVCGEGDTLVELPETSDAVEVVREKCDELYRYVAKLSTNLSAGHVLKRQACYLPVLNVPTSSGPLVGETNVDGLYVASGHSCWGINNAPATGKVMAELLLEGEAHSADISALDPSLYFDASVFD
ncbi:TDA3 (YHR009C) [Zygosaccharomyces parabailii]|nr:TDA3 (YHR009C) [Zygosaccharomyces parabailii]CDH15386.1 related to Putative oxidoreductase TDA3 [Zygosaccharomyces bailii ISA1307]SJM87765.1 related to Putative oxidoreductase TDA3 [Zygosaccharomyces bailii]